MCIPLLVQSVGSGRQLIWQLWENAVGGITIKYSTTIDSNFKIHRFKGGDRPLAANVSATIFLDRGCSNDGARQR